MTRRGGAGPPLAPLAGRLTEDPRCFGSALATCSLKPYHRPWLLIGFVHGNMKCKSQQGLEQQTPLWPSMLESTAKKVKDPQVQQQAATVQAEAAALRKIAGLHATNANNAREDAVSQSAGHPRLLASCGHVITASSLRMPPAAGTEKQKDSKCSQDCAELKCLQK